MRSLSGRFNQVLDGKCHNPAYGNYKEPNRPPKAAMFQLHNARGSEHVRVFCKLFKTAAHNVQPYRVHFGIHNVNLKLKLDQLQNG